MIRLFMICVSLLILFGCSEEKSDKEFAQEIDKFVEEANTRKASMPKTFVDATVRSPWPLVGERYELGCESRENRPLVFLKNKKTYAINGAALGLGRKLFQWEDGRKLLKEGFLPVDLGWFVQKGIEICKSK